MRTYDIAVVGATGNVGREILQVLAERRFPVGKVYALASSRSVGKEVSFGDDKTLRIQDLASFDFTKTRLALFSPGAKISAQYAPKAAAAGCVVIDNTSFFRMDPDVPLVVPEVNPEDLAQYRTKNIIANPNCSTIQLVVALKPLHDIVPIKRVVVATYQSVSGAGKEAMDELFDQTKHIYVNQPVRKEKFTKQIAFNVIPHIDVFMDDGFTKEEWKMRVETKKILDADIELVATCVRVPVFIGHSEAVFVEFAAPISVAQAKAALQEANGVALVDEPAEERYITPHECVGDDATYVSRLRQDPSQPNSLAMWVVSDNLRKGAALNAVQIAEELIAQDLL